MGKHVRFEGARVVSHSKAGDTLVEILDLNDPKVCEHRAFVNDLVATCAGKIDELERVIEALETARNSAAAGELDALAEDLKRAEARLLTVKGNLLRLAGRQS